MRILGWHLFSRRSRSDRPSPLAGVLPRLRTMREDSDWPPSTTPANQEQRRERVLRARHGIAYRPTPHDTAPDSEPAFEKRMRWFWIAATLALICAAVVLALLANSPRRPGSRGSGFSYRLANAPSFLSEPVALAKAREALSQVVWEADAWTPIQIQDLKGSTAPDGARDVFLLRSGGTNANAGMILFNSVKHTNVIREVTVELQGKRVECVVWEAK